MATRRAVEPTVSDRIERLKIRAEMRSAGEDEISSVIQEEALARRKVHSSTPAPAKGLVAVLHTLPPWSRVVVVLALLGVVAFAIGRGVKIW